MKIFSLIFLIPFALSIFSHIEMVFSNKYHTSYVDIFLLGRPRSIKMNSQRLKELEKEKELRIQQTIEQAREEEIYRKYLASRVKSSLISDFLTSRY